MNRAVAKAGGIVIAGMLVVFSQGCGVKWLQSGGETETASTAGSRPGSGSPDGQSQLPSLTPDRSNRELSGFSQHPSEERLAAGQGGFTTSRSPADVGQRRSAELTKEEKLAMEAGLQDVFFAYDQWMVSHAGMESLDRDAAYLKDHPGAVLKIEGHCDERGTSDYNMVLGDKRAKAARAYLIDSGVSPKQVAIVSFGKERPFCFDPHESCYQQNRRGHMLLSVHKK
jgi:peptidoglycan-associated lipoprotein